MSIGKVVPVKASKEELGPGSPPGFCIYTAFLITRVITAKILMLHPLLLVAFHILLSVFLPQSST